MVISLIYGRSLILRVLFVELKIETALRVVSYPILSNRFATHHQFCQVINLQTFMAAAISVQRWLIVVNRFQSLSTDNSVSL